MMRNSVRTAATAVIVMTVMLIAGIGSPASAASQCDAADFTVGGEFDLDGYLACLNGAGGGLPATGGNTIQIVAIAIGLLAIGAAFVVTAYRGRPDVA